MILFCIYFDRAQLQVSLIEPLLDDSDVDSEVKMTKMNNLEWDLYIPAGQSKELKVLKISNVVEWLFQFDGSYLFQIKYEVKHPSGERFELEEILDY